MIAYFKAVGKFIDNCGLTIIMVNVEMIANESTNGFITGKYFYRCKRLHPIITLALKILHFENFVEQLKVDLPDKLKPRLLDSLKSTLSEPSIHDPQSLEIIEKYELITIYS